MILPDEKQAAVFSNDILPHLEEGNALALPTVSTFTTAQIPPRVHRCLYDRPEVPVTPSTRIYVRSRRLHYLPSTDYRFSPRYRLCLRYRLSVPVCETFHEETETDIRRTSCSLRRCLRADEAGYEILVKQVMILKMLLRMYARDETNCRYGLSRRSKSHALFHVTLRNGDYCVGKRIITEDTKNAMREVLAEIQDGTFARNWVLENQSGQLNFKSRRRLEQQHDIEKVGAELRSLMSWTDDIEV